MVYNLAKTGAQIDAIHTKVDGIEASADVTDATNVTAAGALMDSEVTNLAQVKAFDSTDYATAAQGALADSAQQPPSEGAFANGDKTKLDGIETSADVTDETNVVAALDGATLTAVTVATGDKVMVLDASDSDNLKTVTAQSIADLSSGGTPEGTAILSTGETVGKVLQADGDNTCSWVTLGGGGDALVANPLSQFAATTSLELKGTISDETGSGALVFATSPTLVTPALGTPASGTLTNCTGLPAAGLSDVTSTAAELNILDGVTATTAELNYTDGVTSNIQTQLDAKGVGDALTSNGLDQFAATTSLELKGVVSDETGSGALVFATSPTLVTPALGTPSSGTLTNCTGLPAAGLSDVTSTAAELNILDGVTATTAELNYVDGVTSNIQTQIDQQKEVIMLAVSDETTDLTTGTAKITFRMPFAMTLTDVRASVGTAPTGSTIIVDINDGGTTIMTTNKLSIDATEKTSTTAATAPGITDSALADDAEITVDIDQVGSTIAGAGLKVTLIGTRT